MCTNININMWVFCAFVLFLYFSGLQRLWAAGHQCYSCCFNSICDHLGSYSRDLCLLFEVSCTLKMKTDTTYVYAYTGCHRLCPVYPLRLQGKTIRMPTSLLSHERNTMEESSFDNPAFQGGVSADVIDVQDVCSQNTSVLSWSLHLHHLLHLPWPQQSNCHIPRVYCHHYCGRIFSH